MIEFLLGATLALLAVNTAILLMNNGKHRERPANKPASQAEQDLAEEAERKSKAIDAGIANILSYSAKDSGKDEL